MSALLGVGGFLVAVMVLIVCGAIDSLKRGPARRSPLRLVPKLCSCHQEGCTKLHHEEAGQWRS